MRYSTDTLAGGPTHDTVRVPVLLGERGARARLRRLLRDRVGLVGTELRISRYRRDLCSCSRLCVASSVRHSSIRRRTFHWATDGATRWVIGMCKSLPMAFASEACPSSVRLKRRQMPVLQLALMLPLLWRFTSPDAWID